MSGPADRPDAAVVSDDPVLGELLAAPLEGAGLTVERRTPAEIEELLAAPPGRVVVIDLHCPELNGVELARRLARRRGGPRIVGALVAHDHRLERRAGLAGVDACLTPPWSRTRVVAAALPLRAAAGEPAGRDASPPSSGRRPPCRRRSADGRPGATAGGER